VKQAKPEVGNEEKICVAFHKDSFTRKDTIIYMGDYKDFE